MKGKNGKVPVQLAVSRIKWLQGAPVLVPTGFIHLNGWLVLYIAKLPKILKASET